MLLERDRFERELGIEWDNLYSTQETGRNENVIKGLDE